MTPATLRTLMARAFAEEANEYEVVRGNHVSSYVRRIDAFPHAPSFFSGDRDACQLWINERGIAAAMRVAAVHIADCDGLPPGTIVGVEFGKLLDAECVFATLGETE